MDRRSSLPKILVAGASGHLGQRVVELLHNQGYTNLVAASRTPSKLQHLADLGIQIRRADFNDPGSLPAAFEGIDRLLLISTDELHKPGLRIRQHGNAIDAAKASGVEHIVYTSMPNPDTSFDIPFARDHVATEQALKESDLHHTTLRVSWYAENLLAYLPKIIQAGRWPTVAGDGKIPYVPREDVARVTVATLINETESNTYDITGTAALTIANIAEVVEDVFGRKINVEQIQQHHIANALLNIGISETFVPTVIMTDLNTKAGRFDNVNNVIEQLTGKAPRSLRDFLQANISRFITIP